MTSTLAPCARCASRLEPGDLLCAVCGALAEAPAETGAAEPRFEVLRCGTCGAAMRYDARERGLGCAFCGAVTEREELHDPPEQTQATLPFLVPRPEAVQALERWLGRGGLFRPSDLSRRARVESLRPLCWVAWIFDVDAVVSWTADSDAGAGRAGWAPHSGQARLVFDDVLVSASRGLTRAESAVLTPSYDLDTARPGSGEELEDVQVEAFDVQRSMARSTVLAAIESHAAGVVEERHVPGRSVRNVHVAVLLSGLETRRLALPAWVLAYRYRDRLYRVVISGQDAETVSGRMPLSVGKIAAAVLAALLLVALVAGLLAA